MANLDLARLKALAEQATKGPWNAHGKPHPEATRVHKEAAGVSSTDCLIYSQARDYVCLPETFARQLATAEYIAACSPDVILSLIARLEQIEQWATTEGPQIDADGRVLKIHEAVTQRDRED